MPKVRMVKCSLRSPGGAPSVRYVPLREFSLWKYYMTQRHGKIVEGEEFSMWVDSRSYGASPPRQPRPLETVVRVDLSYWDASRDVVTPVERYFPFDEYGQFRETFLSHYPETRAPDGRPLAKRSAQEIEGYYISPRLPAAGPR